MKGKKKYLLGAVVILLLFFIVWRGEDVLRPFLAEEELMRAELPEPDRIVIHDAAKGQEITFNPEDGEYSRIYDMIYASWWLDPESGAPMGEDMIYYLRGYEEENCQVEFFYDTPKVFPLDLDRGELMRGIAFSMDVDGQKCAFIHNGSGEYSVAYAFAVSEDLAEYVYGFFNEESARLSQPGFP